MHIRQAIVLKWLSKSGVQKGGSAAANTSFETLIPIVVVQRQSPHQGELEAIRNGLWMTYPTYSAGIDACDKHMRTG